MAKRSYTPKNAAHFMQLGPLCLEVMKYEFPEHEDYDDGNWLNVYFRYENGQEAITMTDNCLRTSELSGFYDELVALLEGAEVADIDPMEPYFALVLNRTGDADRIKVNSSLWLAPPDAPHPIEFYVSTLQVTAMSNQLKNIINRFPVRGV